VRRLMAFSAVANAGYLILALLVPSAPGAGDLQLTALWYYLVTYAISSALVLACIASVVGTKENDDLISGLTGLGRRQPWIGTILTFALISLAGLPPAAGFLAKFGILAGLFSAGFVWPAALALLLAAVSFAYYGRLAVTLWQADSSENAVPSQPILLRVAIALGATILVILSLAPAVVS